MKNLLFLFFFLSVYIAKPQNIDFENLIDMIPPIPTDLSTASDKEVKSFKHKVDSLTLIFEKMRHDYHRVNTPDPKNADKNADVFTSLSEKLSSYINDQQTNKYFALSPVINSLEEELSKQNQPILEQMEKLKYSKKTREQDNEFARKLYDNRVAFSKKKALVYIEYVKGIKKGLQNLSNDINKIDHISIPDYLNGSVSSAAIKGAELYLGAVAGVYQFNVGVFVPTWK